MEVKRMRKHSINRKICATIIVTLTLILQASVTVHATNSLQEKEHHPPSGFKDPTGTYDGYSLGDTILFHLHLNVTLGGDGPNAKDLVSIHALNITDNLPNGLTYVNGTENSTLPLDYNFTQIGQTLIWSFEDEEIDELQSDGWQVGVAFFARVGDDVPDDTFLVNQVTSEYIETKSEAHSNPTTSDTIWVARPILDIEKECPEIIHEGDSFDFTITLNNTGHMNSTVQVVDTLPVGVIYTPGDASATSGVIADNSTHVVWSGTINNVTAPHTVTITIPVSDDPFNPKNQLINVVNYTSVPETAEMIRNFSRCCVEVLNPAILVEKTCGVSNPLEPANITYTYRVTNAGNTILFNVTAYDETLDILILSAASLGPGVFAEDTHTLFNMSAGDYNNVANATGFDILGLKVVDHDSAFCTIAEEEIIVGGEIWSPIGKMNQLAAGGVAALLAALGLRYAATKNR